MMQKLLSKTRQAINHFDMIEENRQISTSEIATKLGVGVRTMKRRIKQMTNMVYVGNGYSGHWEIK